MKKIISYLLLLSLLAILLPGCSSPAGQDAALSTATMTLSDKTGLGILQLEGQALEVDPAQASEMLPLWQALSTLSADSNTSPQEITALNDQIAQTLTSEQIDVIKEMSWNDSELNDLKQKYSASTSQSISQTNSGLSSAPAGGMDLGGGMPGGAPMDGGGAMMTGAVGTGAQATSSHASLPGQSDREAAGGMNLVFARAVINLLQSKINQA